MPPPVRVESKAFADLRIAMLGAIAGYNRHEALGRLVELWGYCTEHQTNVVSDAVVMATLGVHGVDAIIRAELGERVDGERIRVCGVLGRVEWYGQILAASKRGVEARSTGRSTGRLNAVDNSVESESHNTNTNHPVNRAVNQPVNPLTLTLTLTKDLKTPKVPTGRGRTKKPKPSDPTEQERASVRVILDKLGTHTGIAYTGAPAHTSLIVARMREGLSEMDLRKVVHYCAHELEWATKANMQPYLRPETLFGPQTIHRYLDAARAWYAKLHVEQEQANAR